MKPRLLLILLVVLILLALAGCGGAGHPATSPGPSPALALADLVEAPWGAGAETLLERFGGIRSGNQVTTVATVEGRDARLLFQLDRGRLGTVLVTWNDRIPTMEACQAEFSGLKERLDVLLGPSAIDNLEASWKTPGRRARLTCDPEESGEAVLRVRLSGRGKAR